MRPYSCAVSVPHTDGDKGVLTSALDQSPISRGPISLRTGYFQSSIQLTSMGVSADQTVAWTGCVANTQAETSGRQAPARRMYVWNMASSFFLIKSLCVCYRIYRPAAGMKATRRVGGMTESEIKHGSGESKDATSHVHRKSTMSLREIVRRSS